MSNTTCNENLADLRLASTLLAGRRIATDLEDAAGLRRLVDLRLAFWHDRCDGETAYTISRLGRSAVLQSLTALGLSPADVGFGAEVGSR